MDQTSYFNKSNLKLLGIRDLRKLGFAVGVSSGTVYDKDHLIDHIIDVVSGKEQPKFEKSSGRPTNENMTRRQIFEYVSGKLKDAKAINVLQEEELQMIASSTSTYDTGKPQVQTAGFCLSIEGTMYITSETLGIWSSFVVVPNRLVGEYGLKNGMFVEGVAREVNANLYELLSISNLPQKPEFDFDDQEITFPKDQLVLDKAFDAINIFAPIAKGGRAVVHGTSLALFDVKENLYASFDKENTLLVLPCASPEEVLYFKRTFKHVVATSFAEDDQVQRQTLSLAFETAKQMAECHKEPLIVIDSLTKLSKAFSKEALIAAIEGETATDNLAHLRNILSKAHATEKATITLLAFAETDNSTDKILLEQLLPAFSTKIEISEDLFLQDIALPLNPQTSVSVRPTYQKPEFATKAKEKRQSLQAGADVKMVLNNL